MSVPFSPCSDGDPRDAKDSESARVVPPREDRCIESLAELPTFVVDGENGESEEGDGIGIGGGEAAYDRGDSVRGVLNFIALVNDRERGKTGKANASSPSLPVKGAEAS